MSKRWKDFAKKPEKKSLLDFLNGYTNSGKENPEFGNGVQKCVDSKLKRNFKFSISLNKLTKLWKK